MTVNDEMTFEEQINRLEEIVDILDDGNLPLDESLKLFEEGVSLARKCSVELKDARGKLTSLVDVSDGNLVVKEFDINDSGD